MTQHFIDIASTPGVRAIQVTRNGRPMGGDGESSAPADRLGPREQAFIVERDSFYLATVSETGWPHVQHRGGPRGFLKVLNPGVLAFADYRGNRQYVSAGNLEGNGRAALMLMDYVNRARLKLFVHAESLDLDVNPALTEAVAEAGKGRRPERIIRLRLEAFDWNCSQHIIPRYTAEDIATMKTVFSE